MVLGLVISPLPMAFVLLIAGTLTGHISNTVLIVLFAIVAYVVVLVPLVASKLILWLLSWQDLRRHFAFMFVLTFSPMLCFFLSMDLSPDTTVSYRINDSSPQVSEFAISGVLVAAMVALINSACMTIYWRIAVGPENGARDSS